MRTIVIGVGNPDRRDDGAGILVARRLRGLLPASIEILERSGEGAELMESWKGADLAILIDAVQSAGKPGAIHRLDAHTDSLPSDFFHYSTHAFSVAEAIEMARVLGELPSSFKVFGIEGRDFQPGQGLSPEVAAAIEIVVNEIWSRIAPGARATGLPQLPACEIPPE